MHRSRFARRSGFTLIELLVVIALLIFILAMTVALWPKFSERQKVQKGADLLAEWLLTAKQQARRDGAPRGLRLAIDPNGFCTTAYYTEQLPDLKGGLVTVQPGLASAWFTQNIATGGQTQTVDITGGNDAPPFNNKALWAVQPGDRLEVVVNSGFLSNDTIAGPNPTKLTYVITDEAVLAWGPAPSFTPMLMQVQLDAPVQLLGSGNWSSRGAAFGGVDTVGIMVVPPVPPPMGPTINQIYVADVTNITVGTQLVIDQAAPGSPPVLPNGAFNAPTNAPEEKVRVIGGSPAAYGPMLPNIVIDPSQPVGSSAGYLYVSGSGNGGGLLYAPPTPPNPGPYHSTKAAFPVRNYRYPYQTEDYRIIRRPRVLTGENPLELPQNVVVDFTQSFPVFVAGQTQFDILFSPSGSVLFTDLTSSKTIFWLRDRTLNPPDPPGDQVLIGVFSRTGQISAHPPDFSNPPVSYFNYFLDGRSSGM
jgi:prepilin-type N-terminal cleavage/methylation domain-containing protein